MVKNPYWQEADQLATSKSNLTYFKNMIFAAARVLLTNCLLETIEIFKLQISSSNKYCDNPLLVNCTHLQYTSVLSTLNRDGDEVEE